MVHTAEGSHVRSLTFREASDELISPHPLDTPDEVDSSDMSGMSSTSRTSHDDASLRAKQANAILRLPPEVIERYIPFTYARDQGMNSCSIFYTNAHLSNGAIRILWAVDADTFASAVLLNRQWNSASQKIELYAHHLSRCPSFALTNNVITGPFRRNDLKRLKSKFATEVRRNLFEAYLRPRETLVNLICYSANSSAAFPGGEAFRFIFSPNGQILLALSSSRIFVLDLTSDPPSVRRELKTSRRALSASITDDGSLLAVLSTKHQANIYGLTDSGVKHIQVLVLDNPPRTITLAHEGTVLAAAYEGGVEVFSLSANALSTDRRAVRCEAVDTLAFSGDGSMLVGSSLSQDDPSAVIITAPFYTENDPNVSSRDLHSRMWTTQILFPNNSSTCSHAVLLQSHCEGEGNWLFAFDHTLQSYRAVRTDDTRTGVAYFLSPPVSRRFSMPSPTIAPTASAYGDLVVAGFSGTGIWLYGIPEKVDTAPDMGSVIERDEQRNHGRMALTSATGHREPLMAYSPSVSGSSESIEDDSLAGRVDWRQSIFVKCRHLKSIDGLTEARWVEKSEAVAAGFPGQRLAVVAPGGVNAFAEDMGDESMPVDGGRISILDFDYGPREGGSRVFTIEVGEKEPEILPEQHGTLDVEVALERRRTVRQARGRGNQRVNLGRSATSIGAYSVDHNRGEHRTNIDERLARNSISQPPSPDNENPRSPDSLHRAATAAGISRARYPPRPPLGSAQGSPSGHIVYRRQDGREIPHESDADNWEPPPPPYKRSPPAGAPVDFPAIRLSTQANEPAERIPAAIIPPVGVPVDFFATSLPRHATEPAQRVTEAVTPPRRASTTMDGMMTSENAPARRPVNQYGGLPRIQRPRGLSESSLDTLTELTNHQTFSPGGTLSRADTSSPIITPLSVSSAQFSPKRRAVSTDGRMTSDSYFSLHATISRPMPTSTVERFPQQFQQQQPPQQPQPIFASQAGPSRSPIPPVDNRTPPVTLTGSNLQNRLNHPVPPLPSLLNQQLSPTYIPPKLQVGNSAPAALLPPNKDLEPFTLVPPTPDQVANLHRRVSSETRGGPFPITTTPTREYHAAGRPDSRSESRDYSIGPVPPSPPRAAWGAAGVPGSLPFTKAHRNANSNSQNPTRPQDGSVETRTGSRGSPRSTFHSSSSPSLLTQSAQQMRPQYGRLDTIESVRSVQTYKNHARNQERPQIQSPAQGVARVGGLPLQAPRGMYNPSYLTPNSNAMPTSSVFGHTSGGGEKKSKRTKRAERKFSDASTQDGFAAVRSPANPPKEKKKGNKCAVM